jgi:hypothetical protein
LQFGGGVIEVAEEVLPFDVVTRGYRAGVEQEIDRFRSNAAIVEQPGRCAKCKFRGGFSADIASIESKALQLLRP